MTKAYDLQDLRKFAEDEAKKELIRIKMPLSGLYSKPVTPAEKRPRFFTTGNGKSWEISDRHNKNRTIKNISAEEEYKSCLDGLKLISTKRKQEVDPLTLLNIKCISGLGLNIKKVMNDYSSFKELFYYLARDRAIEITKKMNV